MGAPPDFAKNLNTQVTWIKEVEGSNFELSLMGLRGKTPWLNHVKECFHLVSWRCFWALLPLYHVTCSLGNMDPIIFSSFSLSQYSFLSCSMLQLSFQLFKVSDILWLNDNSISGIKIISLYIYIYVCIYSER